MKPGCAFFNMHELTFSDSVMPAKVVCLGLPLRPYSLGHELILLAKRNPLLVLSEADYDALPQEQRNLALIRAADTCSMTWEENNFTPVRFWEVWKYRRVCRKWRKHLQTCLWPLELAEMRNYLQAGRAMLPTLASGNAEDAEAYEVANKGDKLEGGRAMGSPLIGQLTTFAMRELRLSHEAAMDFPFGHLANLYFVWLESKGGLAIENSAEMDARATMQKFRNEVKAEKAAAKSAWELCKTDGERLAAVAAHPRILDLYPEANQLKGTPCPA